MATDDIPLYTPFFGVMGAAAAMVFSGMYLHNLVSQDVALPTMLSHTPWRALHQTMFNSGNDF